MSNRKVVATLVRGRAKEVVWRRFYSYMDTAMPRAVQMALHDSEPGDVVVFASIEYGFQLGVMHVHPKGKFDLVVSDLVTNSPSLLKLM